MQLTPEEQEVLGNIRFIQTKRVVSGKIIQSLEAFRREADLLLDDQPATHWLKSRIRKGPKISRGENYGGLPYFVLDHPREFSISTDTLAIRTMVLWGNFYSFTLHVTGDLRTSIQQQLIQEKATFEQHYYCINHTPWEYHYESGNYRVLSELSNDQLKADLQSRDFTKLSIYHPLSDLEHLKSRGLAFYQKIISLNA